LDRDAHAHRTRQSSAPNIRKSLPRDQRDIWKLILVHKSRNTTTFPNTTIRQTVKITLGTEDYFRLRLSNAFGTNDLALTQVTVALACDNLSGSSRIEPHTLRRVTFDDGLETTTIVGGAQAVSDPICFGFSLLPNTVLSISIYLKHGQDSQTGITSHPGSRTSSFCSLGNCVSDTDLTDPSAQEVQHW
jgi:hypothetical protein